MWARSMVYQTYMWLEVIEKTVNYLADTDERIEPK